MQRENWKLKQHLMDVKRTMRKHKIELNATMLTFPEVESWTQEDNTTNANPIERYTEKTS